MVFSLSIFRDGMPIIVTQQGMQGFLTFTPLFCDPVLDKASGIRILIIIRRS